MNIKNESVGRQLFELQPEGTQFTLRACHWAVHRAEYEMARTLNPDELQTLGSKLSAPLLLLASVRTNHLYRWSSEHRLFAARTLLERLTEETGGADHD